MYEVELKFAVPDPAAVIARLAELGTAAAAAVEQSDRYFDHPSREFARTDEAFRVRSVGSRNFITYKGPVLDSQTKTRREIETPFAEGSAMAGQMAETLTALGFRYVREVRKTRVAHHLRWHDRDFEIAVDRVDGLGSFIEIETQADESDRHAARDAVLALAAELGLAQPERRSYLRLLLERDGQPTL
jgi:adenylate cyclase class 2